MLSSISSIWSEKTKVGLLWAMVMLDSFGASLQAVHVKPVQLRMTAIRTNQADQYMCKAFKLHDSSTGKSYITGFVPQVNHNHVHHMLVFACTDEDNEGKTWACQSEHTEILPTNIKHGPICRSNLSVLYAWTHGAGSLYLPENVAFYAGRRYGLNSLVMQFHYKDTFKDYDTSGCDLTVTDIKPPKRAGVLLMYSDGMLKPKSHEYFEMTYRLKENVKLHPFAFRMHAHGLGIVNSAYHVYNHGGRQFWVEIGRRSPQLSQIFAPTNAGIEIEPGDYVTGICTMYNSNNHSVYVGQTRADEMCNVYIMYWADHGKTLRHSVSENLGPPREYFEDHPELDVSAIPRDARVEPPPPNGREKRLSSSGLNLIERAQPVIRQGVRFSFL